MSDLHDRLTGLLARGERVAVATVIRRRGSTPRGTGAKMLVWGEDRAFGTIGGGALEASVMADARACLAGAGPAVKTYDLVEGDDGVGMTCGGRVEIFIDVEEPAPRLVVFGAGHVGRALAAAARVAGLAVTVVDDRADWLLPEAFPEGTTLHRCQRDYGTDLPAMTEADMVAVMTRCHATDVVVLEAVARVRPRYAGFIGSRRKIARAFQVLASRGVDRDWLASVHAPIGLDIGAETPGEIAIAVAAQLVAVVRGAPVAALPAVAP